MVRLFQNPNIALSPPLDMVGMERIHNPRESDPLAVEFKLPEGKPGPWSLSAYFVSRCKALFPKEPEQDVRRYLRIAKQMLEVTDYEICVRCVEHTLQQCAYQKKPIVSLVYVQRCLPDFSARYFPQLTPRSSE